LRIEELLVPHQHSSTEKEFVTLLKLALTMETTLAVWCWRHVHLDQINPEAEHQVSLRNRAEAAVDDADRLVNMLSQLTGMPFPLDWVSSSDASMNAEGWSLSRAMRDHIALTADRIALGLYERLIEHARRHHAFATNLLDEIASRRRKRLLTLVEEGS
jgi:hypothetical protein